MLVALRYSASPDLARPLLLVRTAVTTRASASPQTTTPLRRATAFLRSANMRSRRPEGERECSQGSRSSHSPPPRSSPCWSGCSSTTGVSSEAGRLRADIHHAANRALGGESLLAIRVDHATPVAPRQRAPLRTARLRVAGGRRLARGALAAARALRRGHSLWRGGMNTRMLVVVFAGQEAAAIQGLPALLAAARSDRRQVRLACFHALPAPRLDRYDRVVADADREMARIIETTTGALTTAVRQLSLDPSRSSCASARPVARCSARRTSSRRIWSPSSRPRHRAGHASARGVLRRRVARRQARLLVVETPRAGRRQLPATPALALP